MRTSVPGGDGDMARPAVTWSGVTTQARTHWLFLLLLGCGVVLRWLVQVTYDPAIFFFDSFTYLLHAFEPAADSARPLGYPLLFLRPLLVLHDLGVIPLVQHICALAMASGVYAFLLHRGLRHWLAALAVAPVLLDGYLLQIEQNIASDTVFLTLVVGALVLLMWRPRPTVRVVAVAGLLLGIAATVRFVGGPLVLLALLYVLLVSRGRARLLGVAAMTATAALPLLVYSAWTFQYTGEFRPGGGAMSARTLYARTVPLADCGQLAESGAPAYVMRLCPSVPPEDRIQHPKPHMQKTLQPSWTVPGLPPGVDRYDALRDFGSRVVRNQPVDVTAAVLDDFVNGFAWARFQPPDAWSLEVWRFPVEVRSAGQEVFDEAETTRQYGGGPPSVDADTAWLLRDYQSVVYTRGPVFALGVLLPLAAAAVAVVRRRRRTGLVAPGLLVSGTALVLLLSAAAYSFSWRYQLPAIPLLPWAAALGLAALWPGARRDGTAVPSAAAPSAEGVDQSLRDQEDQPVRDRDDQAVHGRDDQLVWEELAGVDDRAVAALFGETHGDNALAPVVVLMAAHNEAGAIGGVLEALPKELLGLPVDVLVVDDGSTDATFDIAKGHGAYVAWLGGNYGQGTALRVGYR
ncbi:MAG: glycosyltransferase, partial [Nocardioidaceae bacterium]